MTGPSLPRKDPFALSDIGEFVIGVSPIGNVPPFDIWNTIISQYANSATITALIQSWFDCLDQTENIDAFFQNIWDITTAVGYGLDVWGRILGVTRVVQISGGITYFGFHEAGAPPFGYGTFNPGVPSSTNFSLPDAQFRTLLYAKAAFNISDGSIKSINQILLGLFPGRGNCYVTDGLDLTMTYTFAFSLSPVELAILSESGVLPRTSGVAATIVSP